MAQLERFPGGLKMSDLSRRMMVTSGNVTGVTDMLEKEGLVMRVIDTADRRALRVKLTASGQRLFKRMAAEHERWVIELFDGLGFKRKQQLALLLGDLKRSVRAKKSER
jgi:DNA-binding MarR family transcriptional regulator